MNNPSKLRLFRVDVQVFHDDFVIVQAIDSNSARMKAIEEVTLSDLNVRWHTGEARRLKSPETLSAEESRWLDCYPFGGGGKMTVEEVLQAHEDAVRKLRFTPGTKEYRERVESLGQQRLMGF